MNRWRMRGAAVLAVIALAVAGCDQQPGDLTEDDLMSPDMDMTLPTPTDDMGDMDMDNGNGAGASPSP